MMVTMFATCGDKFTVRASAVNGHKPGVCLSIDDKRQGELDLHLDTPGELVRLGEEIVGEGMRLMREAQQYDLTTEADAILATPDDWRKADGVSD